MYLLSDVIFLCSSKHYVQKMSHIEFTKRMYACMVL